MAYFSFLLLIQELDTKDAGKETEKNKGIDMDAPQLSSKSKNVSMKQSTSNKVIAFASRYLILLLN